jgi:aryl-alcohol dehydrogenase-like predicted oxidoreductase
MIPWLRDDVFTHNLAVVDKISELAKKKGITPAQLSLAWILAQGDDVFAIPGTRKIQRLKENLASLDVQLSAEEERRVRVVAQDIKGGRVQDFTGYNFADTPPLESA